MDIALWTTVIVFVAYFALVYTANKSGWLERHNMSVVLGFIVMWRTQRGKELIERLSGRGSPPEILRNRLREIGRETEETKEELATARQNVELVGVVREYRALAAQAPGLRAARDEAAREERELEGPASEDRQVLISEYKQLKAKLRSLEELVPPDSKFLGLLKEQDEEVLEEQLEKALDEAGEQERASNSRIEELKVKEGEVEEELRAVEASQDFEGMERKARRRLVFWRAYGNVSIGIVLLFMFLMLALLVWQAFIVVRIPPGLIKPQQMLGIPGVNPVIPLWYGILGLAVAMMVHELAHGILSRVGKVIVKSLGLLFMVVPIGAFVEPDEEELSKIDRKRRSRVFAVGPATNIIVGMVVVMVFAWGFMGSVEPVEEGVVLNYIVEKQTLLTTDANGSDLPPVTTPAFEAGIKPWSILTRIEGEGIGPKGSNVSDIRNHKDFLDTMDRTRAGLEVNLTWYHDGREYSASGVELMDRGEVYGDEFAGQGYLGAGSRLTGEVPAGEYPKALAHPRDYIDDGLSLRNVTFLYISLPFTRPSLQPAPPAVTQAFKVTGPLAALGDTGFWVVANLLYWIFWLNVMVGIFNALPAIPLDGGYIFRDGFSWLIQRLMPGKDRETVDGMAMKVTFTLSFLILLLIIWQFVGPYFGASLQLLA